MTQERLADDAGLARTYVGELERAEKTASLETVDQLAASLGVDPAELLKRPAEGEERAKPIASGRKPRG